MHMGIGNLEKLRVELLEPSTFSDTSRLWQIVIILGNYFCPTVTKVARY